jgi:hypothetical protein
LFVGIAAWNRTECGAGLGPRLARGTGAFRGRISRGSLSPAANKRSRSFWRSRVDWLAGATERRGGCAPRHGAYPAAPPDDRPDGQRGTFCRWLSRGHLVF